MSNVQLGHWTSACPDQKCVCDFASQTWSYVKEVVCMLIVINGNWACENVYSGTHSFLFFFVFCHFWFLSYRHLCMEFLQFVSSSNAENRLSKRSGHSSLKFATSSPAHIFAIRGRRKRSHGTLHTRDQNLPK